MIGFCSLEVVDPPRRAWRSRPYLDFVRRFRCVGCNAPAPSEPHHCAHPDIPKALAGRGTARKVADQFVVPVCRPCHRHHEAHRAFPGLDVSTSYQRIALVQLQLLAQYVERETVAPTDPELLF